MKTNKKRKIIEETTITAKNISESKKSTTRIMGKNIKNTEENK